MFKLLELADAAINADERCMLCSVVRLEGSGYGRVGARLLLTESGDREGYISGGCLEKDLMRRVWSEAAHSPRLMAFDTRGHAASQSRYNTGCQGVNYVLCQPFHRRRPFFVQTAARVVQQRQCARLLTVYHSQWQEFRAGDALARFADGSIAASSAAMQRSVEFSSMLDNIEAPFTATLLDSQNAKLELCVETLAPPKRLVIFGSGDDVQPVARAAVGLGWEVWVMGQRLESTTAARFPGARVHLGRYANVPLELLADTHTHVLLMTHDLTSDLEILPLLVGSTVGSLGTLGSKSRLARLVAELHQRGTTLTTNQVERIRCPVGLDIGASSPEEIATSIMAELIAIEHGKSCMSLSAATGSIHAREPHIVCQRNKSELTRPTGCSFFVSRGDEALHGADLRGSTNEAQSPPAARALAAVCTAERSRHTARMAAPCRVLPNCQSQLRRQPRLAPCGWRAVSNGHNLGGLHAH